MNDAPLHMTEDSGRIVMKITGGLTNDRLEGLSRAITDGKQLIHDVYKRGGVGLRVLLDLSEFNGMYSVESMEAMADFAHHNKQYIAKTAGFGATPATLAGEITTAL